MKIVLRLRARDVLIICEFNKKRRVVGVFGIKKAVSRGLMVEIRLKIGCCAAKIWRNEKK